MKKGYLLFAIIFFVIFLMFAGQSYAQTFSDVGAAAGVNDSGLGHGVAWGDFNNDGFVDI